MKGTFTESAAVKQLHFFLLFWFSSQIGDGVHLLLLLFLFLFFVYNHEGLHPKI